MYGNFYPLRLQHTATGREYRCLQTQNRIGRSEQCELVFGSNHVLSRCHAEFLFRDNNWYIRDTNSVNGTYVNGRRLAPMTDCLLNVGDEIRLAPELILKVLPTSAASAPDWRNDTVGFEPVNPGIGASIAKCTVCGHYFDLSHSMFCPNCGFRHGADRQPQDSTITMNTPRQRTGGFCPKCGNKASGLFCNMCGTRLTGPAAFEDSTVFFEREEPAVSHSRTEIRLETCPNGHVYDRAISPVCPICGGRKMEEDSTVFFGREDVGHTAAPSAPICPPSMASSARPGMAPPPAPSMAPSARPGMAPHAPAAAAPAKKPGLLGKLFGGKKTSEPAPSRPAAPIAPVRPEAPPAFVPPQPAAPQADDVQFRGAAPQNINPGEYFTVKIMMYREDDYARADRETAAVADQVKAASSGVFQASRGQNFRIVLQSPDIDLDAGDEILVWNGVFAAADFEVYLPDGYDRKQLRLRGRVYSGDAVLTDLKLILQVSAPAPQQVVCEKVRMQTAFISYASADRAKVVARLQGIMLARPDMDLFFDVESLRRGEAWEPRLYKEISQRDLFYLFWSHNAAASEWVRKELEYAVTQKTVEFIEPIPLEQPDVCPPPEILMCKHFNDWTLRYLNNQ